MSSKGLGSFLDSFKAKLDSGVRNLQTLTDDMDAMKDGIKNNKPYSRQTIEPMTRLRKTVKDLEVAKANPNRQFIRDRTHDILGI